jgi:hypothetical protein
METICNIKVFKIFYFLKFFFNKLIKKGFDLSHVEVNNSLARDTAATYAAVYNY